MMHEENVVKEIKKILKENEGCSLNVLHKQLRSKDARIGKTRLKSIIFTHPYIKVVMIPKKYKGCDLSQIDKCQACGCTKLKEIYEEDLKGSKKLIAKKCTRCRFIMTHDKCKVGKYKIYEVKS